MSLIADYARGNIIVGKFDVQYFLLVNDWLFCLLINMPRAVENILTFCTTCIAFMQNIVVHCLSLPSGVCNYLGKDMYNFS